MYFVQFRTKSFILIQFSVYFILALTSKSVLSSILKDAFSFKENLNNLKLHLHFENEVF